MSRLPLRLICFGTTLLLCLSTVASEPIVLEQADIMRTTTFAGKTYRELDGNVQIRWGTAFLECELARMNQESGTLHAVRNVVVTDLGRILHAEEVTLDDPNQRMEARGNVHFESDTLEAWCEKAIWEDGLQRGRLYIKAHVMDKARDVELHAGDILIDNDQGFLKATRSPALRFPGEDAGRLLAHTLLWKSDQATATAIKNVHFENPEFDATCDSLIWDDANNRVEMYLSPSLVREGRELTGSFIEVHLDSSRSLDSLLVRGNSRMASPSDSVSMKLHDVLMGETMDLAFDAGNLQEVRVEGQATSIFFMRDEAGNPGMNVANAPQIRFLLDEQELRSINMIGGVEAFWLPLQEPLEPNAHEVDSLMTKDEME
jgi:hypothetical protein